MNSIQLILTAIIVSAVSGLPACFFPPRSRAGQRLTTGLLTAACLTGLAGVAITLGRTSVAFGQNAASTETIRASWLLPWGEWHLSVDGLGALFLALVFIVSALGSIYGLGYWKQSEHPENGRKLGLFYGLLAASMALVTVARDGVLFLIAWEVMALAAYFAATVDSENPEVRKAGWVYLIATHIGTLCLFGMFALWKHATGSFALEGVASMPEGRAGAIFILAALGFGFKAGFMPLHVWLPGAHANAPSHVSAVMSGVMLKMGIFGILRITSLFGTNAAWWGVVLLVAGAVTGVAGILFALGQHDLKRLLAYSSIENIGIIGMGLGLALLGRAEGRMDLVLLGLSGALLHVVNHGLFKPLLFLNAGAVIHAVGTRETDRLGGLAKTMPAVALLFGMGAVAISALPPLNGFVSEWLVYLGLFRTLEGGGSQVLMIAASAAGALAMIGALAVACFVKLFGSVFLGAPRTESGSGAHDPGASMMIPMALLAGACLFIGLFPSLLAPSLEAAVAAWRGNAVEVAGVAATASLSVLAPLGAIGWVGAALIVPVSAILFFLRRKPGKERALGTWDCGYAKPTARMQYTGSSFAESLVRLFRFVLWPKRHDAAIKGVFPKNAAYAGTLPDLVLDRVVTPFFAFAKKHVPRIRFVQQGQTHWYLLYILVITIVLLAASRVGN